MNNLDFKSVSMAINFVDVNITNDNTTSETLLAKLWKVRESMKSVTWQEIVVMCSFNGYKCEVLSNYDKRK